LKRIKRKPKISEVLIQAALDGVQSSNIYISDSNLQNAISVKSEVVKDVGVLFDGISSTGTIDVLLAEKAARKLVGDLQEDHLALMLTTKLKGIDAYTFTHSVNVCILSMYIALTAGYEKNIVDIGTGALLHDIGKTQTPESILRKDGPLEFEEMDIIRQHPANGAKLLIDADYSNDIVLSCVLDHHEKLDGSGYPGKKHNSSISPFARITCIADIYDALTTDRPYRKAFTPFDALLMMGQDMDGQLDPLQFEHFVSTVSYTTHIDITVSGDYLYNDATHPEELEQLKQPEIYLSNELNCFDRLA
jgi:putative nucleotidyltransferase with HDIG domain